MGNKSEREALNILLALQKRNTQLWAVTSIVMVSLVAGLLLVTWHPAWYPSDWRGPAFLPQAMAGLMIMTVLLSLYLFEQKRRAAGKERDLFGEVLSSGTNAAEFLDPETQVFQRSFLDYALAQESTAAAVEGTPTCVVMARAFQLVPASLRGKQVDRSGYMRHAAYLLRRTFRGSDTIIRESGESFLVLMSNTTSEEARCALNRLVDYVNRWNLSSRCDYEIVLSWQMVSCSPTDDLVTAVQKLRVAAVSTGRPERDSLPFVPVPQPSVALAGLTI